MVSRLLVAEEDEGDSAENPRAARALQHTTAWSPLLPPPGSQLLNSPRGQVIGEEATRDKVERYCVSMVF